MTRRPGVLLVEVQRLGPPAIYGRVDRAVRDTLDARRP
jgi:hypothetical protein